MPKPKRHCVDLTCPRPCSTLPRGGSFWSSSRRSAWQWATPRERQYGHGQTQVAKTRAWVLYARGSWYCTYLDAPPAVLDQLLHRQDSQINLLEMLAVFLFAEGQLQRTRSEHAHRKNLASCSGVVVGPKLGEG